VVVVTVVDSTRSGVISYNIILGYCSNIISYHIGMSSSNITGSLKDITIDQIATIQALELALTEFVQENKKFGNLNDHLTTVVSFLNGDV
jgi:hypothetical protein